MALVTIWNWSARERSRGIASDIAKVIDSFYDLTLSNYPLVCLGGEAGNPKDNELMIIMVDLMATFADTSMNQRIAQAVRQVAKKSCQRSIHVKVRSFDSKTDSCVRHDPP
jgi:hypothetical protein